MVHQNFINFARTDLFATAIDDFFESSRDTDVALGVHDTLVPGAEPAIHEGLFIGRWVTFVAGSHIGAADHDFAGFTAWQQRAIVVHDADFRPSGNAYFARFAHCWRKRIAGHLMGGLGHAVGFNQRCAEDRFEFGNHLRWHGRR